MREYTKAFKLQLIKEVLSGIPKETVRLKYGIKGKSAILNWMRKLGYAEEPSPELLYSLEMEEKDHQTPTELQKKIRQLERALEDEQLRSEAYRRVIEKAEEKFKINIRKKSDTK